MKPLNKFPLKDKLLLLGILPAITLAITLAVYFTSTRLNDIYDLLHKTNENLASSIAESSVNGVFSGNKEELNNVLKSAINKPDIVSIKITNKMGTILSQASNRTEVATLISPTHQRVIQPIRLKALSPLDEFDDLLVGSPEQHEEIIGYIVLTFSNESMKQREQDILLNSAYITLIVLFVIGTITKYISTAIGKPILQLTHDVKNISSGHYPFSPNNNNNNNNSDDEIYILSTGIHNMAYQIGNHQQSLENKILEATKELQLQNDKLFEAQEAIIRSADAKSRFISHISHEIRTPLNGIIGFLEIIQKTSLNNEQTKLVNASHLSSKNLHLIINEVLDFAQLEAGKVVINKTNFHVQQIIQDTLLLLSTQANNNAVILNYTHDSNVPDFINQDAVKFGQILMNLIGNAIKFSPNSTVTVSVKMSNDEKNQLDVSIQDQGIGISKENIKQLFQEFAQLDDATSDQGTGLGLVITKHILNALNGSIKVDSVLGKGSTFTFSLPFTKVLDSYTPLTKTSTIDRALPDLAPLNILVADDNEINRLLLTNLLERQNATVTCVNDGQQAIKQANLQPFDLMLLDLRMPIKMGNEALFEIRNNRASPNYKTPAIAITAHITSGEETAHHISSFDGYLIKPIDQQRFFSLVEQLLKEHDYDSQPFVLPEQQGSPIISNKSFDYDIAKVTMNADPAFMVIMLTKFFAELPSQRDTISNDINQDNMEGAADIVHKVHGSAAYCGTPLLKLSSKQLEVALRENDTVKIARFHQCFNTNIDLLITSKDNILETLKNSLEK